MEKEFVPYAQALELKELGFDEPCFGFYSKIYGLMMVKTSGSSSLYKDAGECLSPTYSAVFRWFREKYNLYGQVNIHTYFIYDISNDELKMVNQYDKLTKTYEESETDCLKKLIEIVKNKL